MKSYSRSQLSNPGLFTVVTNRLALDRETTADLLADLAEMDTRRMYAEAGYESMKRYCIQVRNMSEDVAYKRVRAALAARRFPVLYHALADGRVHLAAVVVLAPHFTAKNIDELLAAATHQTMAAVELLVAERFPKADMQALVRAIFVPAVNPEPAAQTAVPSVEPNAPKLMEPLAVRPAVLPIASNTTMQMVPVPKFPKFTPLSPGRFAIQFTMSQRAHEKLRHAQALLGHEVPWGDVEAVMERALDALIADLEKQKFAATSKPRARRSAARGRYIPAEIKREVRLRDGGRCTFVIEKGQRCESRARLEMDHIVPVARGGQTSTGNLRLLCRAHNQYEAECALGAEFMNGKREEAKDRAALAKVRTQARALAPACVRPAPTVASPIP